MIGEIVNIYHDEFNTDLIGEARLVKLISRGLPIILPSDSKYEIATDKQLVYRFDKYIVEFIDSSIITNESKIYPVRILHKIGKTANKELPLDHNLQKDSFLKVNGKEIY